MLPRASESKPATLGFMKLATPSLIRSFSELLKKLVNSSPPIERISLPKLLGFL